MYILIRGLAFVDKPTSLPLWDELRQPVLSPTELLVVESDGLVPQPLLMRAYRTLHLMTWSGPHGLVDY